MPVTPEALALQAELDAQLDGLTTTQEAVLIAAWAAAWTEVAGDLQDTLLELMAEATAGGAARVSRAAMLRSVRLRAVLADINDRLTTLTADAGVTVTADLDQVVADAAEAQAAIVRAQLPADDDAVPDDVVDLLDRPTPAAATVRAVDTAVPDQPGSTISRRGKNALEWIVERTTQDITSRLRPVDAETAAAIRAELVRGISVGENPRRTAARMVRRAEGRFNGGLNRALVIARTEMLDAHRAAAMAEQLAEADVLAGWIWLCHLDPRTCPSCMVNHGKLHPLTERGPDDHPQGRCVRMPKTKSWRDLGIDLDEPEDAVPDARAFFDALSEAEQRALLGPRRYELLVSGAIAWEDLTQRRTNDGWRESWGLASVADLTRATAAAAS